MIFIHFRKLWIFNKNYAHYYVALHNEMSQKSPQVQEAKYYPWKLVDEQIWGYFACLVYNSGSKFYQIEIAEKQF